ncbi:MAG: DMT family transporter [Planctomycetaceae bacterium]
MWEAKLAALPLSRYNAAMPYVLFVLICVIWSGSFLLMKKAALVFSPIDIGAWRVTGGVAVLALLWLVQRQPLGWRRRDLWSLAFVVFAGYTWPYYIQPWLIVRHGSAFIGMTVSFTPLFTILASVPLLGVVPHPRQTIGVLGSLAGMGLLMSEGFSRQIPITHLLLAASVSIGYALVNVWIRRRLTHVSPLTMSLVSMGLASVALHSLSFGMPSPPPPSDAGLWPAVLALLVLGILGTGLAMFWFNKLIHDRGPLFAGMVTNLIPAGAVIWGWLDNEQVTGRQLTALAIILPMVALVQFGSPRTPFDNPAEPTVSS